jgi:hypothetical protein
MIHRNNDHERVIQANPKEKAQDLVEVIRFRMYQNDRIDSTDKENFPPRISHQFQLAKRFFKCRRIDQTCEIKITRSIKRRRIRLPQKRSTR